MTVTTETQAVWSLGFLLMYAVIAVVVIAVGIWLGLWLSRRTGVLR